MQKEKGYICRGDIYYVSKRRVETIGSEQHGEGRPAVIMSNNANNKNSSVVQVVYLTTAGKTDLPTHVPIKSAAQPSIALCEAITPIDIQRIGRYIGHVTTEEMDAMEEACAIGLNLHNIHSKYLSALATYKRQIADLEAQLEQGRSEIRSLTGIHLDIAAQKIVLSYKNSNQKIHQMRIPVKDILKADKKISPDLKIYTVLEKYLNGLGKPIGQQNPEVLEQIFDDFKTVIRGEQKRGMPVNLNAICVRLFRTEHYQL